MPSKIARKLKILVFFKTTKGNLFQLNKTNYLHSRHDPNKIFKNVFNILIYAFKTFCLKRIPSFQGCLLCQV